MPEGLRIPDCIAMRLAKIAMPEGLRIPDCISMLLDKIAMPEGLRIPDCIATLLAKIAEGLRILDCIAMLLAKIAVPEGLRILDHTFWSRNLIFHIYVSALVMKPYVASEALNRNAFMFQATLFAQMQHRYLIKGLAGSPHRHSG